MTNQTQPRSEEKNLNPSAIGLELKIGRLGRENAQTKSLRLLTSGRVAVRAVDPQRGTALAFVRGDSGLFRRVEHTFGDWSCDCPARTSKCSHVLAVAAVVSPTDPRVPPGGYSDGGNA